MNLNRLKESVSDIVIEVYLSTLKNKLSLAKKSDSILAALFIPPASSFGSLGDEAMIVGSIQYLKARGFQKFGLVSWGTKDDWQAIEEIDDIIMVDNGLKTTLQFIQAAGQYTHLYCVGADVMDGFYSNYPPYLLTKFAGLASRIGRSSNFLGFSCNESPTPVAMAAIEQMPANVRLCARDPVSLKRLTQHLNRSVNLVADAAFLLQPAQDSSLVSTILQWVRSERQAGRIVIGFNAKQLYPLERKQVEFSELIQVYIDALATTFRTHQNLSFLFIPHDIRVDSNDIAIADAIFDLLPTDVNQHTLKVPMPCKSAEIKALVAGLDVVITGRMHLAIACLGQAVPVGAITYQGKFEGLFQHFNVNDVTISPEQAFQSGELACFFTKMIAQRHPLREQLQAMLPQVKQLAANNFDVVDSFQPVNPHSPEVVISAH